MIYISSACVRHKKIKDSVKELAVNGFKNIELSGGTEYYENFEEDLLNLKEKFNLKYLCHNYFPPPENSFVLNLASLNNETFDMSFKHLEKVISLSNRLGADKFGFHAGFFIDIKLDEIGKKLSRDNLFDAKESTERFCNAFDIISRESKNLKLFIENNVFSKSNADTYDGEKPFMMTSFNDYKSLKEKIDFNLLLDVAHLKVSVKTLGLNWEEEFHNMMSVSDYVHVSDNDGFHDLNNQLTKQSNLLPMLSEIDTSNKDFTLEIYDGMNAIKKSFDVLSETVT